MVKVKLHGRTKYPFKHLEVGDKFETNEPKNNVMTSYRIYRSKNIITCTFTQFENGKIIVLRTA
jgi:hypothetical protein